MTSAQHARLLTAIEFHQRGELAAAERIYRELLAGAPRCFDVLHLLGALSVQNGELAAGIALLQRAIDIDALQANARLAFAELGRRVGLSTPAVIERVRGEVMALCRRFPVYA